MLGSRKYRRESGESVEAVVLIDSKRCVSTALNCTILYGHYYPTVILIITDIPSPTHSFIPGL